MRSLTIRNLKIFFRDKASVFFSLLSVLIIIGLYVLFLGDMVMQGMEQFQGARFLMDSWIMAGMLGVASLTTTLGGFGVMVDDKSKKLLKDFSASPLKRSTVTGGYVISASIIGVILCVVALVFAELYIVAYGGALLTLTGFIKVIGCILLSVMAGSAMVFLLVSFIQSQNAYGTASTVIGTLIGFITGTYIPLGNLPGVVQTIVKVFPISHASLLFRQVMMEVPLQETFAGAPEQAVAFSKELGAAFYWGDRTVTSLESVLVLCATIAVFFALAVWNVSRKRK